MQLMISYSRDDKAWVYELADQLRDGGRHFVWIDTAQLVGGEDWWEGICKGIEQSECVVVILTPKSVGSIYCAAELAYAVALNKPILPLMLKRADMPDELRKRNIQFENVEPLNIERTHTRCEIAFGDIRLRIRDGEYQRPSALPKRPSVPEPESTAEEHIYEVFAAAAENAANNKFDVAEKLLRQVISADPQGLGVVATERLAALRHKQDRARAYNGIVRLMANPTLRRDAEGAWKAYVTKYGRDFDPNNYAALLTLTTVPLQSMVSEKRSKQKVRKQSKGHANSPNNDRDNIENDNLRSSPADLDWVDDNSNEINLTPDGSKAPHNNAWNYAGLNDLCPCGSGKKFKRCHGKSAYILLEKGDARPKEDIQGKIDDYSEAVRLYPRFAKAYHNRGVAYYDQGKLENAIGDYTEAIRLNSQDTLAYYKRGLAYEAKDDLDAALADYSQAIRLNPQDADAYAHRGFVYDKQGKDSEATQDYMRSMALNSHLVTEELRERIRKLGE